MILCVYKCLFVSWREECSVCTAVQYPLRAFTVCQCLALCGIFTSDDVIYSSYCITSGIIRAHV